MLGVASWEKDSCLDLILKRKEDVEGIPQEGAGVNKLLT